jgi:hypothetical protein
MCFVFAYTQALTHRICHISDGVSYHPRLNQYFSCGKRIFLSDAGRPAPDAQRLASWLADTEASWQMQRQVQTTHEAAGTRKEQWTPFLKSLTRFLADAEAAGTEEGGADFDAMSCGGEEGRVAT